MKYALLKPILVLALAKTTLMLLCTSIVILYITDEIMALSWIVGTQWTSSNSPQKCMHTKDSRTQSLGKPSV